MKVLLISNMYPSTSHPFYGIFVKNFEAGIIENGGSVCLAVIKGRGHNWLDKILKYFKFFLNVYTALLNKDYDLIYVHYIGHSLLPLVPLRVFLKKPLVVNAHGSDVFSNSKLGALIQKIVTPIVRNATLVVVPSSYFMQMVSERFSVPKEKIYVSASGGIDTFLFKPSNVSSQDSIFTLGFVSRIDEGKGWDTLLLAILELKKQVKTPFKTIIIGGGAQEEKLLTMIETLHLQNDVEYLGPIPHHGLPSFYNSFDLFIFPTRIAESLGLVALEAMSCGVPVVGSDIGGLSGYISNSKNGFLFKPGNYLELAGKVEQFMQLDEAEKVLFRQNAIDTAKKYDSKVVNADLYRKLLSLCSSEGC